MLKNDSFKVKEIKFKNGKSVFLKSYSWGIPEKNFTFISNNSLEKHKEEEDFDFGSFANIYYYIKDDSLYIYQPITDSVYFKELESLKFENTKIVYVKVSDYLLMTDTLKKFNSRYAE